MNWETIMTLGDSITIGARSVLGYPEYCGDFLASKTAKNWNVVNHAVSGYTSIDLCRSVTQNFVNLQSFKPEVITILVGTNDLKKNISLEDFQIAYKQLIIKSRLIIRNSNIILLQIPELMQGVMLPYSISMNQNLKKYNDIIEDLASQMGIMTEKFDAKPEHFYDGVHLNDSGCKIWGEQLGNFVLNHRFLNE